MIPHMVPVPPFRSLSLGSQMARSPTEVPEKCVSPHSPPLRARGRGMSARAGEAAIPANVPDMARAIGTSGPSLPSGCLVVVVQRTFPGFAGMVAGEVRASAWFRSCLPGQP